MRGNVGMMRCEGLRSLILSKDHIDVADEGLLYFRRDSIALLHVAFSLQ